MMDITAQLKDWYIVNESLDNDLPKYKHPYKVVGNVYGHHRFVDGEQILTSSIVHVDWATMCVEVSSGHTYELVGPPILDDENTFGDYVGKFNPWGVKS